MPSPPPASAAPKPPHDKLSAPARALRKLGLARDVDLALHLPMRYVDETRLTPIGSLRDGDTAQVQGTVVECRVETRTRRQLVVRLADDSGEIVLRLLHFYPSNQKTLAVGQRVRARGEVRGGFFGREMVHPEFRAITPETALPLALTPVYPSSAQLPQAYLRKAVASALGRAPLGELLPRWGARRWANCCRQTCCPAACRPCARPCTSCTTPAQMCRWPRWKTTATRPGSG